MLPNYNVVSMYPYSNENKARVVDITTPNIGIAFISSGKIICSAQAASYLSFFFPIDSNK